MITEYESDEKSNIQEKVGVSLDLSQWMLDRLDTEAENRSMSREGLVNMWIAEKFEKA